MKYRMHSQMTQASSRAPRVHPRTFQRRASRRSFLAEASRAAWLAKPSRLPSRLSALRFSFMTEDALDEEDDEVEDCE